MRSVQAKCRFDAIIKTGKYEVNGYGCEGCGMPRICLPGESDNHGTVSGRRADALFR